MIVYPYDKTMKKALIQMMLSYFPEVDAGIPDEIIQGKLFDLIQSQHNTGILQILICFSETEAIGFSLFQIDDPKSDWCKRPGWGLIREFYIRPEFRRKGYGQQMENQTVKALRGVGAENLYLTADNRAIPFWIRCGWENTLTLCSNDLYIFEKRS